MVGESLWTPQGFAKDFLAFLEGHLKAEFRETQEHFESYASTSLWMKAPEGDLWKTTGISEEGALLLSSLKNPQDSCLRVTTANHDLGLFQQANATWFIADIGNSQTKLWQIFTNQKQLEALALATARLHSESNAAFFACGLVSETKFETFRKTVGQIPLARIQKKTRRVDLNGYALEQIGMDRLAAMEGYLEAQAELETASLAILVSFGTATTVDLIESSGRYQGGWIAAGLSLSAQALHENTDLLPLLEIPADLPLSLELGRSTIASIGSGLLASQLGLVEIALKQAEQKGYGRSQLRVFLSGGQANFLKPFFKDLNVSCRQDFLAVGLSLMAFL